MKIEVVSIKYVHVVKSSYNVIYSYHQVNNGRNKFCTDILHDFESECGSLKSLIFLNSAVYGDSYEPKWAQKTIYEFLRGQCQHVGITDTNHNVKITGTRILEVAVK